MTGLFALALVGLASWVVRIGLLVLMPAQKLPATVRTSLDDLAPAVLAAIVAVDLTSVLTQEPDLAGAGLSALAAGVIALVAWRTRNTAVTVLVALVAVCGLDLFVLAS